MTNTSTAFTAKDGAVVILGGAGMGGLIGFSTLSFTNRPQKRFGNVAFGAALGIVAGVGATAFLAATDQSVYERIDPWEEDDEELPVVEPETAVFFWRDSSATQVAAIGGGYFSNASAKVVEFELIRIRF